MTESLTAGAFGSGTGPIWMSGLTCSGLEGSLFVCTATTQLGWVQNTTTCTHANDVAVRCRGLPSGDLIHVTYYAPSDTLHTIELKILVGIKFGGWVPNHHWKMLAGLNLVTELPPIPSFSIFHDPFIMKH